MATISGKPDFEMKAGLNPLLQVAGYLSLAHAVLWGFLFFRWMTFGAFDWTPFPAELALAQWPPFTAYLIFGIFGLADLFVGMGLLKEKEWARQVGIGRSIIVFIGSIAYYLLTREFYGAAIILGLAGMLLLLLLKNTPWAIAWPAAYWLLLFFVIPNLIVLIVSLGERSRLGTVSYPALSLSNLGVYFDDYIRFFSPTSSGYIYLVIFARSVWLALLSTLICLLFGYPFAYWIARQPARYRNFFIFLVMIPFWTNFLVRTFAWMLILRDSGLINTFWTMTLHEQAVRLADQSAVFAWFASITENRLPLLFNQSAVLLGMFYGYLPFMVLPLYSSLEQMEWSLMEAAADLGANTWQRTTRILIPLTLPGIISGSIIVFIPSLGTYVIPDLMGGAKVTLLGNLLQQQFMTVRDWPFGSAIGFITMTIMLLATMVYFRSLSKNQQLYAD